MYRIFCNDSRNKYWIDVEADSYEKAIDKYFDKFIKIYDADVCGIDVFYFAVKNEEGIEKFFKLTYSWWIDYDPEWNLEEETEIEEVSKSETEGLIGDRDWLKV